MLQPGEKQPRTIQVVEDKPFLGYVGQGFAIGIGTIGAYAAVLLLLGLLSVPTVSSDTVTSPVGAGTGCTSCPKSWVS